MCVGGRGWGWGYLATITQKTTIFGFCCCQLGKWEELPSINVSQPRHGGRGYCVNVYLCFETFNMSSQILVLNLFKTVILVFDLLAFFLLFFLCHVNPWKMFLDWEEVGVSGEHPRTLRKNMQTQNRRIQPRFNPGPSRCKTRANHCTTMQPHSLLQTVNLSCFSSSSETGWCLAFPDLSWTTIITQGCEAKVKHPGLARMARFIGLTDSLLKFRI